MRIFRSISEWQTLRANFGKESLGFVPTMGCLHAGHASLLTQSKAQNEFTALSIFVNPTQFDEKNDLWSYPKTEQADIALAESLGVDFLLMPDYQQLYPDEYRYQVRETEFSQKLCGAHRPGHFDGMLTIVIKLLNLVKAHRAYFGEKDFQQLELIRGMAQAFFLSTEIIACPIVREADGLAMSSRNTKLSPADRIKAAQFHKLLAQNLPLSEIKHSLERAGFRIDYVEIWRGRKLAAVHLGNVRLIDNVKA